MFLAHVKIKNLTSKIILMICQQLGLPKDSSYSNVNMYVTGTVVDIKIHGEKGAVSKATSRSLTPRIIAVKTSIGCLNIVHSWAK